jgi:phage baseplate assembly protein W
MATYDGFSTVGRSSLDTKLHDVELVKQDLRNHFFTRLGEVRGDPRFGCIIWDMLAEPFDDRTEDAVVAEVERIIGSDPRVRVLSLDVQASREKQSIAVAAELLYVEIGRQDLFSFTFEGG